MTLHSKTLVAQQNRQSASNKQQPQQNQKRRRHQVQTDLMEPKQKEQRTKGKRKGRTNRQNGKNSSLIHACRPRYNPIKLNSYTTNILRLRLWLQTIITDCSLAFCLSTLHVTIQTSSPVGPTVSHPLGSRLWETVPLRSPLTSHISVSTNTSSHSTYTKIILNSFNTELHIYN